MVSIRTALNVACDARDRRAWWRQRLDAVTLTVWFSLFTLLALVLLVFGERVGDAVAGALGVGAVFTRAWNIARWPVILLLALLGITLVYHFAPAVRQRWPWVTPASAFALIGWLVVSYGLRLYVRYVGNYNATLLWLYLSGLALLIGAEIDALVRVTDQRDGARTARR